MSALSLIGVEPIVNAVGYRARFGGKPVSPAVSAAVAEGSSLYVDYAELELAASRRIAELTRNEDAHICGGAAAGLLLAALVLVCQREPQVAFGLERRVQYRAVVHRRHRVPVDKGLILAGLKLVEIGDAHQVTREELEAAIDPQTLCIVYVAGDDYGPVLPLNVVIDVARSRGVAVVVDAAAELPPRSNLWYFSRELGADLTIFSGGKDLGAPAGTGLIVGRPELVGACRKLDSPNGTLARPLKVGADGVLGMMAAVSEYMARDDSARWRQCEETIDRWQAMMLGVQGISSRRVSPCKGLPPLALAIAFDDQLGNKTAAQAKQFLWEGSPRVAVGQSGTDEIVLASYTLGPGDEDRVARRLLAFLGR